MDVVLYFRSGSEDSRVIREYLQNLGVAFRSRQVDRDAGARREWEDLDGEVTPLVVIDRRQIVRGLDRSRLDQLLGWIGC